MAFSILRKALAATAAMGFAAGLGFAAPSAAAAPTATLGGVHAATGPDLVEQVQYRPRRAVPAAAVAHRRAKRARAARNAAIATAIGVGVLGVAAAAASQPRRGVYATEPYEVDAWGRPIYGGSGYYRQPVQYYGPSRGGYYYDDYAPPPRLSRWEREQIKARERARRESMRREQFYQQQMWQERRTFEQQRQQEWQHRQAIEQQRNWQRQQALQQQRAWQLQQQQIIRQQQLQSRPQPGVVPPGGAFIGERGNIRIYPGGAGDPTAGRGN